MDGSRPTTIGKDFKVGASIYYKCVLSYRNWDPDGIGVEDLQTTDLV